MACILLATCGVVCVQLQVSLQGCTCILIRYASCVCLRYGDFALSKIVSVALMGMLQQGRACACLDMDFWNKCSVEYCKLPPQVARQRELSCLHANNALSTQSPACGREPTVQRVKARRPPLQALQHSRSTTARTSRSCCAIAAAAFTSL